MFFTCITFNFHFSETSTESSLDFNLTFKQFPMFSQPLDNLELKTIAEVRNQSREEEKDMVRKKVKGLLSLLSKTDKNQEDETGLTIWV